MAALQITSGSRKMVASTYLLLILIKWRKYVLVTYKMTVLIPKMVVNLKPRKWWIS